MTYEERQQAICKECGIHDERCAYFIRNMQDDCPKITSRMVGWELGYKDAIDKACEWLENNLLLYWGEVNANNTDRFIRIFKQAMEEQQ